LRKNGKDEDSITCGKNKLIKVINNFNQLYGLKTTPIFCSDFMRSNAYNSSFKHTFEQIQDTSLVDKLYDTIPENKRHLDSAIEYPIHELACVKFLSEQGYSLKIGPTKEKQYDQIMDLLSFEIKFAYLLDAYALGTKSADIVVHYVPNSRGPNNGQRIFLEDEEGKVKNKLQQGCDEALRYFCKIGSVSGNLLGLSFLEESEIDSLYGKRLKRETIRLVMSNIIKPYSVVKK
jgi:hypothetical protein